MSFMERLQSAIILKTPMHHPLEAHIVEHPYKAFLELIQTGNEEGVIGMVLNGFDVDNAEAGHTPPLIHAIMHERSSIVQILLIYGANPTLYDHHRQTPLHAALKMKAAETIHLLMRYGADALFEDENGMTPLQLAKKIGEKSLMRIITHTQALQENHISPFHAAAAGDLHAIVLQQFSSDKLFEYNKKGQTLLHLAIPSGNIKLVAYLLNKGLDIDAVDQQGDTALTIVVRYQNQYEMLSYLLKRHATIDHKNSAGSSALTLAITYGYADYVELLLDNGANINTFDGLYTPLTLTHNALKKYPQEAKKFRTIETTLLIKGASVDIRINKLGWTPLIHLCTRQQDHRTQEHMELLLHLGSEVNYADSNGRTALMLACSTGRTFAVEKLLDNYADSNKLDNFGWSALMFGVYYNHHRIVHMLLEYGTDVNITSERGLNALKIAMQHQHKLLIELLLDYGAITKGENRE
ncbi:MAG: ankyrin repeat domain-containing protein [Campylobacterota bacterium]|nr:ankyrin repeat domain-containing protein [Campylobacterota bacterium]